MSEYQYYDFKAIDHALTKAEMAALRSISTRAVITSTSFTNHYEWGDLKADPLKLLAEYFDAFVYVTNWGTREFYLRWPQGLIDSQQLRAMLPGKAVRARNSGKSVIVSFESEVESDDWDDGAGWMGSLMSLRSDLLRGDLRCLYLGWLLCVQNEEFSGDTLEPPVPAGLREISAPLDSLTEFLGIDEDLVGVAAAASEPLKAGPSRKEFAAWIQDLPVKDKDHLLVAALSDSFSIIYGTIISTTSHSLVELQEYDRAAILLTDLRDLAVRQGRESGFQSALEPFLDTRLHLFSRLKLHASPDGPDTARDQPRPSPSASLMRK